MGFRPNLTMEMKGQMYARDRQMRDFYDQGWTQKELAQEFGISQGRVSQILNTRTVHELPVYTNYVA